MKHVTVSSPKKQCRATARPKRNIHDALNQIHYLSESLKIRNRGYEVIKAETNKKHYVRHQNRRVLKFSKNSLT